MTTESYGAAAERSVPQAVGRGLIGRCPNCGIGRLFGKFLKVSDHCPHCGEALHHQRADDAPPYVVIAVVGHVIVGLIMPVELAYHPPMWVHMALWLPLTTALSIGLLQPVKGALVGLQWAIRMHGFDPTSREAEEIARRADPAP